MDTGLDTPLTKGDKGVGVTKDGMEKVSWVESADNLTRTSCLVRIQSAAIKGSFHPTYKGSCSLWCSHLNKINSNFSKVLSKQKRNPETNRAHQNKPKLYLLLAQVCSSLKNNHMTWRYYEMSHFQSSFRFMPLGMEIKILTMTTASTRLDWFACGDHVTQSKAFYDLYEFVKWLYSSRSLLFNTYLGEGLTFRFQGRKMNTDWFLYLFIPGFPPEPELSSALKSRDLFEDPPFSFSDASPSLSVTPPSEPTSPIGAVFGSGSIMVTTVTDEHPPTLPPASTKPQVTPVSSAGLLKAAPQCEPSVWGETERKWAPLLPLCCHDPHSSS